jgi:hypothetical protein
MNADLAHELLNELGSSLENLETQQAALLQFLKHEGIVTDDQLAPYLTQAGNASNVRWRAARVRLERLISTAKEKEEKRAEKEQHPAGAAQAPIQNGEKETSKNDEGSGEATPQRDAAAANAATESAGAQSVAKKDSAQDERATGEDKKASPKPVAPPEPGAPS